MSDRGASQSQGQSQGQGPARGARGSSARVAAFDDRYGEGAHARLLRLLDQSCVSFARIARDFSVTRECVRQWHAQFLPEAPQGAERRRQCLARRQKRRLFEDPLFASFYRHARPHLPRAAIRPVPSQDGYRKKLVTAGGRLIFIKAARVSQRVYAEGTRYVLCPYRGPADFIYYQLTETDYLLVPCAAVPASGTTFVDRPASKYQAYRNTFVALEAPRPADLVDAAAPGDEARDHAPANTAGATADATADDARPPRWREA